MSNIDVRHYRNLKEEFGRVCKRVLKENLTTNPIKHREYLTDLATAYNAIISYIADFYDSFDAQTKEDFRTEWIAFRDKILRVYGKLNVSIHPPKHFFTPLVIADILRNYDENSASDVNTVQNTTETSTSIQLRPIDSVENKGTQTHTREEKESDSSDTEFFYDFEQIFYTDMAPPEPMSKVDFLAIAGRTINHNYDGDPLGLAAFINSVGLLKEFTDANLNNIFLRFVKSKLVGKALESIPANPASVDEIIRALEEQIRPDNSKVVAGRLLALRPDKTKMVEFSDQAEKLAEALQRSLIIEGISQTKAREMSIEKTVEVCRGAARSDLVKSILASTKFESPKEVIAKYVVESSTEEREKQILAFKSYQKQNRGHRGSRSNYNGNGRGKYNNGNGNGYNRGRNNRSNKNYQNNGNGRNYGNNNYNGRGNNYNDNNRGRNNYNGGNRNNNDNDRNVRYAENCDAPQLQLGEAQNRN